jgi:hypothetical protein
MPNLWTPAQVFHRGAREHPDPTEIVAGVSGSRYGEVDARSSSLAGDGRAGTRERRSHGDRPSQLLWYDDRIFGFEDGRSYTPEAFSSPVVWASSMRTETRQWTMSA